MVRSIILFYFLFLFYLPIRTSAKSISNQKIRSSFIGELVFFNLESKLATIKIYNSLSLPPFILDLIKEQNRLSIYDNKKEYYGDFQIDKIFKKKTKDTIVLSGALLNIEKNIYIGLKVRLHQDYFQNITKELKLPDSRFSQKEIEISHRSKTPSNMIYILAGRFIFGSNEPDTLHYTAPVSKRSKYSNYLFLRGFYIDKYEVTHGEFQEFVNNFLGSYPPNWDIEQDKDVPMDQVSYLQAKKYCKYRKKRLPTELEWEKAARGALEHIGYTDEEIKLYDDRVSPILNQYPFGNQFDSNLCNSKKRESSLTSVFSEIGDKSPFGVMGMCGNAQEWTSSWLMPYRGNNFKERYQQKRYKVIRGGSYKTSADNAKTYVRHLGGIPSLKNDFAAGIRCVKDVDVY